MNQFFSILTIVIFGSYSFAQKIPVVEGIEFEKGKFYDHLASNGFGGDGGGELCYEQEDGKTVCRTLIELGLRFWKPPEIKLEPGVKVDNLGLDEIDSPWEPSENVVKSLNDIDGRLKKYHVNLKELALNYGDFSVFHSSHDLFVQTPLKDNYIDLVLGAVDGGASSLSNIEMLTDALIDCKVTLRCSLRYAAVSIEDRTIILMENYRALSPQRASLLLIHEAFIRNCKMDQRKFCLSEALFADGVIYDLLENRDVSTLRLIRFIDLVHNAHLKLLVK